MISKKTKYALKALLYLARKFNQGPVLISDLARDERIPKKFLELILLTLKNNGVLQSRKGKGGGYFLGKLPREISVGNVIRILDGPLAPVPCVSETAYAKCQECMDEQTCGIRPVMKDVRDAIANILDKTSLADMLEREEKAEQQERGILQYFI
jgi:Rrf2 family protein